MAKKNFGDSMRSKMRQIIQEDIKILGDENSKVNELNLYDGLHSIINKDIASGDISEAQTNLIP